MTVDVMRQLGQLDIAQLAIAPFERVCTRTILALLVKSSGSSSPQPLSVTAKKRLTRQAVQIR